MHVQHNSTAGQKREAQKQEEQEHGKHNHEAVSSGLDLVHKVLNSMALKDSSEKVRSLIKVRQIGHRLGSLQHIIYREKALFCGSVVVDRLLQIREQRTECVRTLVFVKAVAGLLTCQTCGYVRNTSVT